MHWVSVKDQRVGVVSSACGWMGALRQTTVLYGSLVLEWQFHTEVCRNNNDHSELLMQPLKVDMQASMHAHTRMHAKGINPTS